MKEQVSQSLSGSDFTVAFIFEMDENWDMRVMDFGNRNLNYFVICIYEDWRSV